MRSNCIAVIALSFVLITLGCHKRPTARATALPPVPTPVATPVATPVPPAPPEPEPAPPPAPAPSPLDIANQAFASGSYDEAARGYEEYLRSTPTGGEQRDQALFHLALTFALRPSAAPDWQRANTTLKQLIEEYPNSPYKAPANLILSLRSELDQATLDTKQREQRIKQLTTELDRLKKIDADRRKRP